MKRLLLIFLILLFAAISARAQGTTYTYYTPTGTGWHDLGATTAMQPNGIGGAGDTCPSNTYGGFGTPFDDGCWNVMGAWNSGIVDQANRRMIVWGGGHTDYGGNEIYGLQIGSTNQFTRYNGPSMPSGGTPGIETLSDPTGPNSRHTYGGLVYMANTQQMMVIGGALAGSPSDVSKAVWLVNMAGLTSSCAAGTNQSSGGTCTVTWTQVTNSLNTIFTMGGVGFDQPFADYWDSTLGTLGDNCVYMFFPGGGDFGNYCAVQGNTGAGVFNDISYIGSSTTESFGDAIEQKSGIMIFVGGGELWGVNISGCPGSWIGSATCGNKVDHSSASGCSTIVSADRPGVAYDEVAAQLGNDDIVVYPSTGKTVYILHTGGSNSATWTCSTESLGANTPSTDGTDGLMGRFRYMRLEDAFIYCPGTGSDLGQTFDCWSYRRRATGFSTSTERTLAYRAANPGVTRATNFTNADLVNDDGSGHGTIEADANGSFANYSQDTTNVPVEGAGIDNAWKIIAPASIGANNSPTFHVCFDIYHNYTGGGTSDCVATYGPTGNQGNAIYFQVRWRADNNAINVEPPLESASMYGGEGWKLFGIHGLNDGTDSTCQALGQVVQNTFWQGFVQGFQNCGSGANFVYGTDPNNGSGVIWENGFQAEGTGYDCGYMSKPSCATFPVTTWTTFYCKWYVPSYTEGPIYPNGSGTLECWWQPAEGVAMQKIFSFEPGGTPPPAVGYWSYNYQLGTGDNYGRLELYDYDTDRSALGTFVQQTFWYSELIVSSQPICAPYGTYGGNCYPSDSSTPQASTPTFAPSSGTTPINVTITSATSGATICYTKNGNTPTAATPGTCDSGSGIASLANGGTITVSSGATVEAIATIASYVNSSVGSATYSGGATVNGIGRGLMLP